MTSDLPARLRAMAARYVDLSIFVNAGAAALAPAYETALAAAGKGNPPAATPEGHRRALELHPHVILASQEAGHYIQDAAMLNEAADLIEELEALLAAVDDQAFEKNLKE